jgi:predicted RND superfamily exporter protein
VLLALGCAYSVHLISAASGLEPGDQEASIQRVALPIALSGLTTALGFIAIAFVRIEAIQSIGVFGALGVIFVLTATLTAGPAALSLWPMPNRPLRFQAVLQQRITPALLSFTTRRYRPVVVCWLVAMTAVSFGIARLNVETDVIEWFQREDPIRLAYTKIRDRLSGISPMNVVIEAPAGKRVSAAEVVSAIDSLSEYLEGLPEVGRSVSIADPLRQMHGEFTEDEELPLPGDDALISQYLIVLESEPFTTDLILSDRSSTSILLRVNDNASGALLRVAKAAESWWSENGPSGYTARVTGIMYEFARAEDAIAFGQLRGLAFALLTVSVILLAIFRWVRLAAIALVPNIVPVVMGFGAMGLLGVPLDAGTVVIGNLAFGIAVDDSIHAVTGFFSRRAAGESGERALELAYRSVLPPLVYTTAVVALGFSVLAFSDFTLIRNLGLLTAALMVLCLLADALLLPAMLSRLNGPDKPAAMGAPN